MRLSRLLALLPWIRGRRALRAAQAAEEAARDAARRRIIKAAGGNAGPVWRAQPTAALPQVYRPLMTPAAEYRTRRNRRAE
jgi:hypothetical protein